MPSRKLTALQTAALTATLNEIREQSIHIRQHIDFIRDNAGLPPFAGNVATPAELLGLIQSSAGEFVTFAEHHVPIYLGRCLIDEFGGHWSIEDKLGMATFGQPYVDGFGNIEYENVYLSMLRLRDRRDLERFDEIRARCRRAFDLRARFATAFADLSGSAILRSELERRCVDLDVLPQGREAGRVWRTRVAAYAKLLDIKIKRG